MAKRGGSNHWNIWDSGDVDIRRVQPYEATKEYLCPGCNQVIPAGMGHIVAVPVGMAEDRRHWHRGCWDRQARRRDR